MEPNYVARKSTLSVLSFGMILSCILIVPIFVVVYRCLKAKSYRVEFYNDKIITYSGLISTTKKQSVFMGVTATSVHQTIMGRICKYGNVSVDCVGKWDIDTTGIKDPYALEEYLQTKIINTKLSTNIINI